MTIDCQYCGDRIPDAEWPAHLGDHQTGKRPVLPTSIAFERHALANAGATEPLPRRGVPVRLWVTSIQKLGELTLTKLPEFGAHFEHEGMRYQIQSIQLADVVDIVLSHDNSVPRPLTTSELELARSIPVEHSCGNTCLRCWAERTGQL